MSMRRKVDPVTVNVLITGCAGNQAHFIWSALKRSSLSLRIIGCNYDHLGAGLYQFDAGYVVPPASLEHRHRPGTRCRVCARDVARGSRVGA